jgi:PAS domain S-box-containing protein
LPANAVAEDRTSRLHWLPAGVLALGLALTGVLCAWSMRNDSREASAELDRQASSFASALASRIQSYVDTLPGLRMFGVVQKSPSDAEFLQYVQAISLQKRFPGLALTFMADLVPNAQRSEYVQSVAADRSIAPAGHPGFAIQPTGERAVYMVLRHTFPVDPPALGYDLYDPAQHYRAAVEATVDGGRYVATGPLLLARDRFAQSKPLLTSVVIRAAIYAHGAIPPTPEARVQAARGVVGISFRTNDLVRSVLPEDLLRGHRTVITDPQARGQGANDLLFDSAWAEPASPREATHSDPWRTRIQVADRSWDVEVYSLEPAWTIDKNTWWLLALGLALSAALTAMTRMLVHANVVADSRVRIATSALESEKANLQALLDNISSGVIVHGADTHIIDANAAACRVTGLSLEQMRGKVAIDPYWCFLEEDGSVMALERFPVPQVLARGSAVNKLVLGVRRPDLTQPVWVQVDAYPLRDVQGQVERVVVTFADITERQRALAEQARMAMMVEGASDAIIGFDTAGSVLSWNAAAESLLGYHADEIVGRSIEILRVPESQAKRGAGLEELVRGESIEDSDTLRRHKNGSTVNVWMRATPIHDPQGKIVGGCAVLRDISERKRADQKLRESESRFRRLFENSMDGVLLTCHEGAILEANPAACRILGRTLEQLRAGGRGAIVDTADPRLQGLLDERAAMGQVSGVFTMLRGDGTRFEAEATSSLYDGPDGVRLSSIVFRDISARVRDEQNLQRVNRTLRVLSSANLVLVKAESEATLLNEVCRVLVVVGEYRMSWVGYAEDDAGRTVRPVARAGDDDGYLERSRFSWDGRSEFGRGPTGRAIATAEVQVNQDSQQNSALEPWNAEAQERGYQASIALPLVDADRTFGALNVYAAQRRAFDPDEVAALEELARNVSFGIGALRARSQRDAAQGANRAKSEFLANMSHEIRTPLNAIVGLNYLLRREGVTPQQALRLDKIDSAGQHLLSIVNDVLDLSKIEAGQVRIETTNFHLSSVLEAAQSIVAESARAKGLAVTVDSDAVPLWLRGDPTRLRQALLNFAGNAVKFTEKGSIALNARLMQDRGDDLVVRFSVTDTGIGLTPEQIPRLFQSFEQADSSITRKFGGTGLGLAITKRLAELMQGECGVDSEEGVGSTFWFTAVLHRCHGTLPAAAIENPSTAGELLHRHHRGARILLAEDNEVNREVALALLEGVGLDVELVADGRDAVAMASAGHYDLVLMDMQMPRMGGLEATRAIRLLVGWESRPILALTANAFDDDRLACKAAGMDDFIAKPMDVHALYATLLKWLDWAAAQTSRARQG